jgi:hypothetical protein
VGHHHRAAQRVEHPHLDVVQVVGVSDPYAARLRILEQREALRALCDACDPVLDHRGFLGRHRDQHVLAVDLHVGGDADGDVHRADDSTPGAPANASTSWPPSPTCPGRRSPISPSSATSPEMGDLRPGQVGEGGHEVEAFAGAPGVEAGDARGERRRHDERPRRHRHQHEDRRRGRADPDGDRGILGSAKAATRSRRSRGLLVWKPAMREVRFARDVVCMEATSPTG